MKKTFSKKWVKSKQPRKQRKFKENAPLHIKGKFLNVNLAKPLREKYKRRTIRLKKGDRVKILRGDNKGKEAKVDRIDVKRTKVYLEGIERIKAEGTVIKIPFHPSNLQITELDMNDKKRMIKLKGGDE